MVKLNRKIYESTEVVNEYADQEQLQKPELAILSTLKDELKHMKMLDIGVGGGRTTINFKGLVSEYIGIDYSKGMIDACLKRFPKEKNVSFKLANVVALDNFKENYFDFVLFSFNGIDCISHDDRIKGLKEIKRVLRDEGVFVFSTHNLYNIKKLYSIKVYKNPLFFIRRMRFFCRLFLSNKFPWKLKNMDWAIVNDGVYGFRARHYYIKPCFQVKQLEELGFKNIKLYSLEGKELDISQLDMTADPWIYYLCKNE